MGSWPETAELPKVICPGMPGFQSLMPFGGATAWASSSLVGNEAYYLPVSLPLAYDLRAMWMLNGAAVAQNVDIGIYTRDGTRLWSNGSVAQGAANALVVYALGTPMKLPPGDYYLAIVGSSGAGTFFQRSGFGRAGMTRLAGQMMQATALPLPATATFAVNTKVKIPIFGIASITTF
jgi:hypothetical protein